MKILLATDGSEYSDKAVRFLTRFHWSPEDSISVFHAIYAIPFRTDQTFYHSQLEAIKKELAPRILDAAVAALKPVRAAISVEVEEERVNQCTPEECIMTVAEKMGADLIVMGARGLKGISSVFLGSVTRQVVIHSSRPVLAVKPSIRLDADPFKIVFATDGSAESQATENLLASLPFPEDSELCIENVLASGFEDIPDRFAREVNDRIKDVVAATRALELSMSENIIEEAQSTLCRRFKKIRLLPRAGDPSEEILKAADEADADLIAVGSRGVRGIKVILGSVSRNVLTHAECSVLVGKPMQA